MEKFFNGSIKPLKFTRILEKSILISSGGLESFGPDPGPSASSAQGSPVRPFLPGRAVFLPGRKSRQLISFRWIFLSLMTHTCWAGSHFWLSAAFLLSILFQYSRLPIGLIQKIFYSSIEILNFTDLVVFSIMISIHTSIFVPFLQQEETGRTGRGLSIEGKK